MQETIAEVLCNLMGVNPNDPEAWQLAMDSALDFKISDDGDLEWVGR